MQLYYEILITAGPVAAAALIALQRYLRKPDPPELPPGSNHPPEEEPTPPPKPHQPPSPIPPKRLTDAELIGAVITHIAFSTKQVQAGVEEVGRRIIGYRSVASDVPENDFDIRPMRDLSERPLLVPGESTKSPDIALLRMLTGQAMVMEPLRPEPITEPITRPIMRALNHTVYVLLDVSGSMYDTSWRIRIGKGVALGLSHRCRKEGSTFLFRPFCGNPLSLQEVTNDAQQVVFEELLRCQAAAGGTAIGRAISQAITDCVAQKFDSYDIMIVTDGEDSELDISALRSQLVTHRIRLHAILIDVNNAPLQQLADVYQQIPQEGVVRPPIVRSAS